MRRYLLYLFRWQLSSPVLYPIIILFKDHLLIATIVGNLVGGMIFFFVDRIIFRKHD